MIMEDNGKVVVGDGAKVWWKNELISDWLIALFASIGVWQQTAIVMGDNGKVATGDGARCGA